MTDLAREVQVWKQSARQAHLGLQSSPDDPSMRPRVAEAQDEMPDYWRGPSSSNDSSTSSCSQSSRGRPDSSSSQRLHVGHALSIPSRAHRYAKSDSFTRMSYENFLRTRQDGKQCPQGQEPTEPESQSPSSALSGTGVASGKAETMPEGFDPSLAELEAAASNAKEEAVMEEKLLALNFGPPLRQQDGKDFSCTDAARRDMVPEVVVQAFRQGGWLNEVNPQKDTMGLPAKTGTGVPTICAALPSSCCIPPQWDEPMLEPRNLTRKMMMHDAERIANPGSVINTVVYDSVEASPFCREGEAGQPPLEAGGSFRPYYVASNPQKDTTLVFESRFESGNLRRAIKVYEYEYDLVLRPDINTKGHTQWFYFSVTNTRRAKAVKFNIINLMKEDSLYSEGMQPVIHSAKEAVATGAGWHRSGSEIAYYENNIRRKNSRYYYTLTFTIQFPHDSDVVHIAHCYPYTYSDLQRYLGDLCNDPKMKSRVRRRPLCQSLASNTCDLITVTNFDNMENIGKRKGVVITGRVHPGETNASWMMKGFLDFISGNSLDARILRCKFVFKIVPMLNPDGVINGNYRCSLAGVDLNRNWMEPSRKMHPTIYNTKAMMKKFMEDREVVLFCDLHGHSRKKDIFLYGCNKTAKDVTPTYPTGQIPGSIGGYPGIAMRLQDKLFPLMLQRNLPDTFSFKASNFKVQKSKESTARIVCWRELGLVNSFTLEASFAGPSMGKNAGMHFNTAHLEEMGMTLCRTLLDYISPDSTFAADVVQELESLYPPKGMAAYDLAGDDDEAPTDSDDEEDSDDGGAAGDGRKVSKGAAPVKRPEPADLRAIAAVAEITFNRQDVASARAAPKPRTNKKQSKQKRIRNRIKELEILSRDAEVATQPMVENALGVFQQRFNEDAAEPYGFLEDSGAMRLKRH